MKYDEKLYHYTVVSVLVFRPLIIFVKIEWLSLANTLQLLKIDKRIDVGKRGNQSDLPQDQASRQKG
jgi:hypothetical protein